MESTPARIIRYPGNVAPTGEPQDQTQVLLPASGDPVAASPAPGDQSAAQAVPAPAPASGAPTPLGDADSGVQGDFLSTLAELGIDGDRLLAERRRVFGEIAELRAQNRWADLTALFHPVEEKLPELAAAGLGTPLRAEVAFALGHLGRYDDAIALYQRCLAEEPDVFNYHAGLAYSAYDSLYAARGRQIMLHPAERKARIELAHRHFTAAQALRPERVTNFYRQGMLFKAIQGKKDEALPRFETAIRNWEAYSPEERKERHQERKNYVKALYQAASCQLDLGRPAAALASLTRCLDEDVESGHLSPVHKYFALGKIHFQAGDLDKALHALEFSATHASPEDDDYVFELLARVRLHRKDFERAWQAVQKVPLRRRRPYFRWTEADVLTARGQLDNARRVLQEAAERDRRGRHKALVRLAKLEFRTERYQECLAAARDAGSFFQNQYQNPCADALFWQAAALVRLARMDEARSTAQALSRAAPRYPHLARLRRLIDAEGSGPVSPAPAEVPPHPQEG